jgi:hypothetical protein
LRSAPLEVMHDHRNGRQRQSSTAIHHHRPVPIISLAEARAQAKQLLAKKTLGLLQAASITFEKAHEKFKTEHVAKKRARTQYDYNRTLERYFLPKLAKDKLNQISYERLMEITDPLAETPRSTSS